MVKKISPTSLSSSLKLRRTQKLRRASLLCALLLLALSFNTYKTYTMEPEDVKKIGWIALAGAAIVGGYTAYKQFLSYIHEEPIQPFNFSDLPKDIQKYIIALLAQKSSAKSLKEAAQIINSLAQANHSLNTLINDPQFCLQIIKSLAQQFKKADSEASRELQIKEARRRYDMQEKFKILFDSDNFTKKKFDDLYKEYPDVDLNFTYDTPGVTFSGAEYGDTLFYIGFSDNKNIDAIKLQCLLDSNADVNYFSRGAITALMLEISFNTPKIVTMLCQYPKTKLNEQNKYGETALSRGLGIYKNYYVSPYFIKNIQILLDAGADPELANNNGLTPLQLAQQIGDQEIIDLIQNAIEKKHEKK
jgi:hypothetical protein